MLIGQTLGHYRILQRLGKGGMGEVYLADDTRLGRKAAVKVLLPELAADPRRVSRFQREARNASAMSHPNIVAVFDVGEQEGVHYLAMEYLEGETLREKLRQGPVPLDRALGWAVQMSEALEYAHAAGLVHRDIKPDNAIISPSGHLKLLDFGLARNDLPSTSGHDAQETRTQLTIEGNILGTVEYMSPEQLRGRTADARSDIFSMGVVLYETLAARRPFDGATSVETMQKVLNSAPDALARFNYDVPEPVERVVRKCLEKDPAWRYQSARELKIDLASIARDLRTGTVTRPVEAVETASFRAPALQGRRNWLIAAGCVAVAAAGVGWWRSRSGSAPASVAVLPFANRSGDPGLDYAAEAIADSVHRRLVRVRGLKVTARSVAQRYRGGSVDALQAARSLGVAAVLTGSIDRRQGIFETDVELVDARTGSLVWSQSYQRPGDAWMDLRDAVAGDVTRQFRGVLEAGPGDSLPTNAAARDLYLRARHHLNRRSSADLQQAASLFQQAIDVEGGFAQAHAGLASAYVLMAHLGLQAPTTILPRALSAARRALELDPNVADAQVSLANASAAQDFDRAGSERAFRRALELDPSNAQAHAWYGLLSLTAANRADEAMVALQRAIDLEPDEPIRALTRVTALFMLRQYRGASDALAGIDRKFFAPTWQILQGNLLMAQGDAAGALAVFDGLGAFPGQAGQLARITYGCALAALGRTSEASAIARELDAAAGHAYISPVNRAFLAVALRQPARAFALLDEGVAQRDTNLTFLAVDPRLDPLRSDPRFEALLKIVKLR